MRNPTAPARAELVGVAERLSWLPLVLEAVELERLERPLPAARATTVVRLRGGGEEGLGEDVTFQAADMLSRALDPEPMRAVSTLGGLWEWLDSAELFERPPLHSVVRSYRRWAVEAAALDLALRQAQLSFAGVVGRAPAPVRFVVSPRRAHSRGFPGARLKIDATDLAPGLPVEIVDFKGEGDAALVERARAWYPRALLEDAPVLLEGALLSWDIRIESAAALERLPPATVAINVKPARLGSVRALFELYAACAARGIDVYGGGQDELGPGRAQIQLLAALFHADAPNDVAPAGYNEAAPPTGLPASPLAVTSRPGFR